MQQWTPALPAPEPSPPTPPAPHAGPAPTPAPPPPDPLAFTPVPRKYRYDGWTAERQRAFIAALAETGSVKAAARTINMAKEGAYYLRRAPGADSFRAAWEAALATGVQRLTDVAIERAIEGVPVPVFHKGEQVGERRAYNDRLLMFVLRHHQPDRYGKSAALAPGTKHPDTLAREAAAACPACKARAKEDARQAEIAAEMAKIDNEQFLERLMRTYVAKVISERRQRIAGNTVAADFYLRQLSVWELVLEGCGQRADLIRLHTRARDAAGMPIYDRKVNAGPLTAILDAIRREEWEKAGEPPRPPIDLRAECQPSSSLVLHGDNAKEREHARKEAQRRIAAGQAMWEATGTEESWAAFKELGNA